MVEVYEAIFKILNQYKYCVMRNATGLPLFNDSNDIDLLINKHDYKEIIFKLSKKLKDMNYSRVERSSFFGIECFTYYSFDKNLEPVKLDYFFDLRGGGLRYIDFETIIDYRSLNQNGIYVLDSSFEAWLTSLKTLLSGGKIKKKYLDNLKAASIDGFTSKFSYLGLVVNDIKKIQCGEKPEGNRLKYVGQIIFQNIRKIGLTQTIFNLANHTKIELARIYSKRRFIVLSGVDGSGKSSLLDESLVNSQNDYKSPKDRFIINHHRPRIIPHLSDLFAFSKKQKSKLKEIYENPRSGHMKNPLSSVISFFYYVLDYILFRVKHWNNFRRGKIIIYDRYYYDFLIDPLRSAISINKNLVIWIYKLFIPRPSMTIYVIAPPKLIVQRKDELNEAEAKELQDRYIEYSSLWSPYQIIENVEFNSSVVEMKESIIQSITYDINKFTDQ